MATITYNGKLGKYGELSDFYNTNKITLTLATPKEVIYADKQGGEKIVFEGSGLKVDVFGIISGGTIDELNFTMKLGLSLISVTKADADAAPLAAALLSGGVKALFELALAGNDTVKGSTVSDELIGGGGKDTITGVGGEDHIRGGRGNDTMDGGVASDTFFFKTGDGDDKITGFDAKGLGRAQDYIDIAGPYTIADSGNDTLITYGSGDSITLVGVDHKQVEATDFL